VPSFNGYDWNELSDALGVEEVGGSVPSLVADNLRLEHTKAEIDAAAEAFMLTKDSERAEEVYQLCRAYLEALKYEEMAHGYNAPVWAGMLKIEDKWTFLTWMSHCLGWMWT